EGLGIARTRAMFSAFVRNISCAMGTAVGNPAVPEVKENAAVPASGSPSAMDGSPAGNSPSWPGVVRASVAATAKATAYDVNLVIKAAGIASARMVPQNVSAQLMPAGYRMAARSPVFRPRARSPPATLDARFHRSP